VMDVIDREKRQAVFQGGIEGVVTKEMMQNKQAAIEQAVAHLFSRYPFVAGQSAPVAPAADKK
jgi:transposase